MGAVQVVTMWILALKMTHTNRGSECQAQVVCNIGGLGLRPNMDIESLVHTIHGFCFGGGLMGGNTKMTSPSKRGGRKFAYTVFKVL